MVCLSRTWHYLLKSWQPWAAEGFGKAGDQSGKNRRVVILVKAIGVFLAQSSNWKPYGAQIMNRLRNLLMNQEGVRFTPDSRVLRLHVEDNRARGVILWNRHLKKTVSKCRLYSDGQRRFLWIYPFPQTCGQCGDGIAMAYEAGIPLMDMEFVQFEPSVAFTRRA